jgi:hypothetical protein
MDLSRPFGPFEPFQGGIWQLWPIPIDPGLFKPVLAVFPGLDKGRAEV